MIEAAIALAVVLLLIGAVLWAGGGKTLHEAHGSGIIEAIPGALEETPRPTEVLVVLSYNIAYGLGREGVQGEVHNAAAVYDRLERIVETIAGAGAEIALLQEVDFASRRTYGVDQLQYIAAALGWGFVARVITWECRYLPSPVWLPHRHAGRVRAGQGVISRYPLVQNTRQRLPQSAAHPLLSPLFAAYDTVQMVDVQYGERPLRILNTHLAAHDVATRRVQAQELVAFVRRVATPNCLLMGSWPGVGLEFREVTGEPRYPHDRPLEIVTTGLQDRLRATTAPGPRLEGVFVGPGLHVAATDMLTLDESVSEHLPLLVHLHWAFPPVIQNRSNAHEHC